MSDGEGLQRLAAELRAEVRALRSELEAAQAEIAALTARIERQMPERVKSQTEHPPTEPPAETKAAIEVLKGEAESLRAEVTALRGELKAVQAEVRALWIRTDGHVRMFAGGPILRWRGPYSKGSRYWPGHVVQHADSEWVCIRAATQEPPPSRAWQAMGRRRGQRPGREAGRSGALQVIDGGKVGLK